MSLVDWCLLHCIRTSTSIPRSFPLSVFERERYHIVSTHSAFVFLLEHSRQPGDVMERFAQCLVELWLTHDLRCRRWLGHHIQSMRRQDGWYPSYVALYRRYAAEMHLPRLNNYPQHPLIRALSDLGVEMSEDEDLAATLARLAVTESGVGRDELLLTALEEGVLCCSLSVYDHLTLSWPDEIVHRLFRVEGLVVSSTNYHRYLTLEFHRELIHSDGFDHEAALTTIFRSITLGTQNEMDAKSICDAVVDAVPTWKPVVLTHAVLPNSSDGRLDAFVIETAHRLHARGRLDVEKTLLNNSSAPLIQTLLTFDYSKTRLCELVRNAFVDNRREFCTLFTRSIVQKRVVALMERSERLRKVLAPLLPLCPTSERSIEEAMRIFFVV